MFKPAIREWLKLRMALEGPAGSGKSLTGQMFCAALAAGKRFAVIDSEHGSAKKYADVDFGGVKLAFDVVELQHFAPTTYTTAIQEAAKQGYHVLMIDSLSHAWVGVGGALEQVEKAASKPSNNTFTAWREVTPQHNELIDTILAYPGHVIATMRTKTDYVVELNEKGKAVPRKIGLKSIQRDGVDYEFDIVCEMDLDQKLTVTKTRCMAINGKIVVKPTAAFMSDVIDWLEPRGVQPAPAAPAVVVNGAAGLANEFQVGRIKELAQQIGVSVDGIKNILAKRGVSKIAQLQAAQADEIIARLEWKSTQQQAQTVFQ